MKKKKKKKKIEFLSEIFSFWFSVYLNRHVFVMNTPYTCKGCATAQPSPSVCKIRMLLNEAISTKTSSESLLLDYPVFDTINVSKEIKLSRHVKKPI